ncbi:MAG TPA: trypsin-like peptidase domain-containing protein [Blastocatellia bacterium]|nr:trypsin-like peptidase domain-containing protein [Blastocatellia bacterium]
MRRYSIITFVIVSGVLSLASNFSVSAQQVSEGQRLAMYSKPSVVRILDGYVGTYFWSRTGRNYQVAYVGSGSGAFINPNGYIATNAHVTDLSHQGEDKGKELLFIEFVKKIAQESGYNPQAVLGNREVVSQIYQESQLRTFNHIHHVILPDGSNQQFEIKAFGAPVGEGKDVSIIKIEVKNAPVLKLGDSDKVQLQDHITVIGYPAAADTAVLDQKSELEASITDGKVSARKSAQDGAPVLQVSAPATHGNSGGPVLNDKGEIIGMLTFRGNTVNGQEVQGFSFVVPSSTINEFVKQAGTSNEEGLADKRYREGLELFWDASYTRAIEKFKEVDLLFPQHSEAKQLMRASQQAIAEGKERSGMGLIIAIVAGVLVLGGAGAGTFFILRKKQSQAAVGQVPSHQYQSHQPYQPQQSFPPQHQYPPPQQQYQPHQSFPPQQGVTPQGTQVLSTPARSDAPGAAAAKQGFGAIRWTTGPLTGQRFDIRPEGMWIGRDPNQAQVKVEDSRVSSRHMWIGPREGRVVVIDQGSTNGTFLNALGTERVREVAIKPGDTIILSQADAARFVYER